MFDDKRYRVAGPTGGPGVLGPWRTNPGHAKEDTALPTRRWRRIAAHICSGRMPRPMH